MKKIFFFITIGLLGLYISPSLAKPGQHNHPQKTYSTELEKIKSLAGTWEGTSQMGDKSHLAKVIYRVTSAGSAVVEELDPGSPHEMISVYHDNNGKLSMTHYCALGNQPLMNLKKKTDNSLLLSLSRSQKKKFSKEEHMHQVLIEFYGEDKMIQTWTSYENGKEKMPVVIQLARVSP